MHKNHIKIGSRGSDLALWQANFTKKALELNGNSVEIIVIKTKGDKIQDIGFDKMEGKGFFTKEIEDALLSNKIDLAVHSHKDLETNQPQGLFIGGVSKREDPSELLLVSKNSFDASKMWNIIENGKIGTSSARRKSLIYSERKDLQILDLRGNVPTRINKLREGDYDAIILAKAGVLRLKINLEDFHHITLDPHKFVPAAAQGALAFQIRDSNKLLHNELLKITDTKSAKAISLERRILKLFNGGCQVPIGVYCDLKSVFVSYSANWKVGAKLYSFPFSENSNFPQEIVNEILKGA
ncbi:MAG: hydroxymethylbilane synthase [Crocinitomicaceae bacterium]|nr:hydroxymethylbilane synthase [Crocinitomicaceae bacterium]